MRSFESRPELLDEYEMTCPYSKCLRTFYTDNSKAVFCCDSHRGKYFREVNADRLKEEKEFNAGMKSNCNTLKRLFNHGIKILNQRELQIAGFIFTAMGAPKRTQDGRTCYQFFEYFLAKNLESNDSFEIIKQINKS